MSDVHSGTDANQGSQAPARPTQGTSPMRLIILLLIFVAALAGLLYDYCIARPAHGEAYETIVGLLDGKTPDPDGDGAITDEEVRTILGCEPTSVEDLTNGKIEIFSWRSGLPYRKYDLFVVYSGRKLPLLHFASTERPQQSDLPATTMLGQPSGDAAPEPDDGEDEADMPTEKKKAGALGGFGGSKKFGGGKKKQGKTAPREQEPAADPESSLNEDAPQEPPAAEPAAADMPQEPPAAEPPAADTPQEPAAADTPQEN